MKGIFTYSTAFKDKFQFFLSLNEGHTPMVEAGKLAAKYGMKRILLKDETKNPSGSFKDRAIAYQLTYWKSKGKDSFVISSSGNAAISAALYASKFNLTLDIFLSPKTDEYKLHRLNAEIDSEKILIRHSDTPRKDAIRFAMENGYINLIHTKDDNALEGYKSLGIEINEFLNGEKIDGIFMPVSSGTGFIGLANSLNPLQPLFAIQTTQTHPIADHFDKEFTTEVKSLASAVSAIYTPRKDNAIDVIVKSGGYGYIINNMEIEEAVGDLKEAEGIDISYDSALSIAGLKRAIKDGKIKDSAICILTGK